MARRLEPTAFDEYQERSIFMWSALAAFAGSMLAIISGSATAWIVPGMLLIGGLLALMQIPGKPVPPNPQGWWMRPITLPRRWSSALATHTGTATLVGILLVLMVLAAPH